MRAPNQEMNASHLVSDGLSKMLQYIRTLLNRCKHCQGMDLGCVEDGVYNAIPRGAIGARLVKMVCVEAVGASDQVGQKSQKVKEQ